MGAGELLLGVLPERVVPNNPVPQMQVELAADQADLRGVIVPDGDPE